MRLIYKRTSEEVKVGDVVPNPDGGTYCITYFRFPAHNPNSSGKVTVRYSADGTIVRDSERELYTHVLGMEWIERGLPETSEHRGPAVQRFRGREQLLDPHGVSSSLPGRARPR